MTQLGWCVLDPPPSLFDAPEHLKAAADALESGDLPAVKAALRRINVDAAHTHYARCGIEGKRRQHDNPVARPPSTARANVNDTLLRQIGNRDGWRCRYCRLPVTDRKYFQELNRRLPAEFPPSPVPIPGTLIPLDRIFRAKPDHVVPVSCGGATVEANLVIACGACNDQAKGDALLEQILLRSPFDRDPMVDGWDGLVGRPVTLRGSR